MNTCKKCGVEIPDDSLFCPNCLEEITLKGNSYDSENSNTLRENKLTNNSAKKSNIEKIIGAIMGVLAIVVIIIISVIIFKSIIIINRFIFTCGCNSRLISL